MEAAVDIAARWIEKNATILTCVGIAVLVLLVSTLYLICRRDGERRSPPGPTRWPLLGSYLNMALLGRENTHRFFPMVHKTYGQVARVYFGHYTMILVSGYDAIHEAFVKQEENTIDRPSVLPGIKAIKRLGKGVLFASGEDWVDPGKLLRSGLATILRSVEYEQILTEEVQMLIDDFSKEGKISFKPGGSIDMAVLSCRYAAITGKRLTHTDPKLEKVLEYLDDISEYGGTLSPVAMVPLLKYLPFTGKAYRNLIGAYHGLHAMLMGELEDRKPTYDGGRPKSVIDFFLKEQRNNPDSTLYSDGNIAVGLEECFTAGGPPIGWTLGWAVIHITGHPSVRTTCQEEIDKVCGKSRQVRFSDIDYLPNVRAALYETQRLVTVVPISAPHLTRGDMTLNGFHIPGQTIIATHIRSAHMDETQWKNPQDFDPSRFLDGGMVKIPPAFMPFGIGPRKCAGSAIAEREVVMMFASLLKEFTFSCENTMVYDGIGTVAGVRPPENNITVRKRA
ncbi:cytochrome P450 2J4-like isoform X1 [Haliotis rufescens]|uniref:cytochrome P450 2J4-like isoform X1 n=1 Tax=Haliotis rufescens TaxID=6454 RepID=UPI00201ED6B5|nr:cytochrome P450 2J4-like isoform X1 [Haliotis rufescens]